MIHRLPTNCQQKLFHLWAGLHTEPTINTVIPLNRTEFRKSVVILHSPTVLMNDPQTADELPTKSITFVGNSSESRRIVRKCSFFFTQSDFAHE